MNCADVSNKVTIKGTGWSSKGYRHSNPRRSFEPVAKSVPFKAKPLCIDGMHPVKVVSDWLRPPSRHKSPPKATGLELPMRVCTPPEQAEIEDMLEKTWSHQPRQVEADQFRETNEAPRAAWDEGSSRPRTSNRRSRKASVKTVESPAFPKRPNTGKPLYEVPLIVTTEEKNRKRILSANRVTSKARPTSKRGLPLQSSLDKDFLTLFE